MFIANFLPLILILSFQFIIGTNAKEFEAFPTNEFEPECLVNDETFNRNSLEKAPWGTVDLDVPPRHRFIPAYRPFRTKIRRVVLAVKAVLRSLIGQFGINLFELAMAEIDVNLFPSPYREEIEGISHMTGVPIPDLVALNLFYEMSHLCTSIIAQNPVDDEIVHGRDLDFGMALGWDWQKHEWKLTEMLRGLTINLNFTRHGQSQFVGTTFAGHLGLFTGMRPHRYSVSINSQLHHSFAPLLHWFARIIEPPKNSSTPMPTPVLWAQRNLLENFADFDTAKHYLSTVPLLSGCYLALGGNRTGQGIVLMRNATAVTDKRELGPITERPWFLMQRNWWKQPNLLDKIAGTQKCMEKLGPLRVGIDGLMAVLSSKNTLNKSTVHTTIMRVQTGYYETFIQRCPDPCFFI